MEAIIHEIKNGAEPEYPCWLFLTECSEWEFIDEWDASDEYVQTVYSYWSKGGRPEAPILLPNQTVDG